MKLLIAACLLFAVASSLPFKVNPNRPEEAGYWQGDIVLTDEQKEQLSRNGAPNAGRWPKYGSTVKVPYDITGNFPSNELSSLTKALGEWKGMTNGCIEWVQKDSDPDVRGEHYVEITREALNGCFSSIGRTIGGKQQINYGSGCISGAINYATMHHEQLHAMGFYHMQSDEDRDSYVAIHLENVQSGYENNFNKYDTVDYGYAYDYDSAMHYGRDAFSSNGKDTIVTLDASKQDVIGQRLAITNSDIAKLMEMYNC